MRNNRIGYTGSELLCSVEAMGIGAGDEVITSPYTDMGTISSILTSRALPVMADLDPASFQIDPADVERKITPATKAIMPVDMGGQPCNMARINAIAKKHKLRVIEDSCQGHLGEYQGKKLGTVGELGCFSFQTSKTIACGEGGAVIGNDEALMDRVFSVMMNGSHRIIGTKYRMTEFEAALLLSQLEGAKERFAIRNRNAAYLTSKLRKFPGLVPQRLYPGTTSGSYYLYMMAYKKEYFNNADRSKFLKALAAEGIELSPYIAKGLHREPWTEFILKQPVYTKMFPPERLKRFRDQLHLPVCDRVCDEMAMIWASGPLLGTLADMDDIVNAIAPADFPTTTQALMQLQLLIGGRDVVDVSPGTTIRAMFLQIFNGKAATLAALAALVKLSDDAKVPWWKANGYPRPFDLGDIEAAGLN